MNLFYLSEDAEECAEMHCNKHVPKMVVETAQLLCNVHHRQGELSPPPGGKAGEGESASAAGAESRSLPDPSTIPYKYSRSGHAKLGPMIWLMQSLSNYRWAVAMGLALSGVYSRRFGGKTHKTQRVLEWLRANEPARLRDAGFTRPLLAMPDEYKLPSGDPIGSYRKYYVYDKHRFAEWPPGLEPEWFARGVRELKARGLYNNVGIAYPTKRQQQQQKRGGGGQRALPVAVKRKRRAAAKAAKVEGAGAKRQAVKKEAPAPPMLQSVARRLGL